MKLTSDTKHILSIYRPAPPFFALASGPRYVFSPYRPASFFSFVGNTRYGSRPPTPPYNAPGGRPGPAFNDQCYCPCLTFVTNQIKRDPFEEQKILFDLEKARGFSTPSYNGTDIPDYYETTTFSPDELDQVFFKNKMNFGITIFFQLFNFFFIIELPR